MGFFYSFEWHVVLTKGIRTKVKRRFDPLIQNSPSLEIQ